MTPEEVEVLEDLTFSEVERVDPLAGGFSHATYRVVLEDETLVVRLGGAAPRIEAAVMAAASHLVPVPGVRAVLDGDPDRGVRPLMVIEHVDGLLLQDVLDARPAEVEARALGREVGRVAAAVGDAWFPRPGFFGDHGLTVAAQPPWSEQLLDVAETALASVPSERIDAPTARAWSRLCEQHAPDLVDVDGEARLVHSDLNPKNVLVARDGDRWRVAALLDWEFAYAGTPYADVANMTRFGAAYPPGFVDGFRRGFVDGLPRERPLHPDWIHLGHVMDMFALSLLLAHPVGHPVADQAAHVVRTWVEHGVPR